MNMTRVIAEKKREREREREKMNLSCLHLLPKKLTERNE